MKRYFLLTFLITAFAAHGQNWTPSTGQVGFKIKMLGAFVEGSFQGIKSTVRFSNNEPSSLYATVETNTVNTRNSLRDKHLKEKEDFFEAGKFPLIQMNSVNIQKSAENQYMGTFKLTLKQITKTVKIPFTFTSEGDKAQLKSTFDLNRKDWNLGGNTPGMSEKVFVSITLNLVRK